MTMTAVAVQQRGAHRPQYDSRQSPHASSMASPQQSRPHNYATAGPAQIQRQEQALRNGTSGLMNPRPAVSNDPVQVVNGGSTSVGADRRLSTSASKSISNTAVAAQDRRASLPRPTSAPNGNAGSSPDDSETDRRWLNRKPLLRTKSDFGPRGDDVDSQAEDDTQDWGARHGFEDHYASEEYVSQLANVGRPFPSLQKSLRITFFRWPSVFPV